MSTIYCMVEEHYCIIINRQKNKKGILKERIHKYILENMEFFKFSVIQKTKLTPHPFCNFMDGLGRI